MKKKNKIKYIVKLKEDFYMPKTTIKRKFCGSIENIANSSIYFKIHGCNALVIIPHNKIEWMAPSAILFNEGFNYENILDSKF